MVVDSLIRQGSPLIGYCSINLRPSLPIYVHGHCPLINQSTNYPSHIFFHGITSQVTQPDSPSAAQARRIGCTLSASLAAPPPCAPFQQRCRSRAGFSLCRDDRHPTAFPNRHCRRRRRHRQSQGSRGHPRRMQPSTPTPRRPTPTLLHACAQLRRGRRPRRPGARLCRRKEGPSCYSGTRRRRSTRARRPRSR